MCFRRQFRQIRLVQKSSTVNRSQIVGLVIDLVSDTAVVEESLNAREVSTETVVADELDQLVVGRSAQHKRSRLVLGSRRRVVGNAREGVDAVGDCVSTAAD